MYRLLQCWDFFNLYQIEGFNCDLLQCISIRATANQSGADASYYFSILECTVIRTKDLSHSLDWRSYLRGGYFLLTAQADFEFCNQLAQCRTFFLESAWDHGVIIDYSLDMFTYKFIYRTPGSFYRCPWARQPGV